MGVCEPTLVDAINILQNWGVLAIAIPTQKLCIINHCFGGESHLLPYEN